MAFKAWTIEFANNERLWHVPVSESRRHVSVTSGVYRKMMTPFVRHFGGDAPQFRFILNLFHYKYGTIFLLPPDPASTWRRTPVIDCRTSMPFYDADDHLMT